VILSKKLKSDKKSSFDRIVYQIVESGSGTDQQAECPELLITGFGDPIEEAKAALRRLVSDYLEDCEEMQILEATLIEAGFYFNGEVWMSSEVEPLAEPKIRFIGRPSDNQSEITSE